MINALQHWLSLRIRLACILVFVVGALLPPYVPQVAFSQDELPESDSQFLFVEEGFLMKTSSLGEQGARLAYAEGLVHVVEEGDSLEELSKRYEVSVQTIQWANNLEPGTAIQPGKELVILPVDGVIHTVKSGQTLQRIAQLYSISEDTIARQNKVEGGFILAGQQLIIPGGKPVAPTAAIADRNAPLQFASQFADKNIALRGEGVSQAELARVSAQINIPLIQGELAMPCENCFYTQGYRAGHYAVDIQTRGGGPIFAAEAGTVIRADLGWNGGYGNVIEIDHGNGLVTLYAHNKTIDVAVGDTVTRGKYIAEMGATGLVHGPTGIHIHFEVRLNGVKKNPKLYLP